MKFIAVALISLFSLNLNAESVRVSTYNAGMLKKFGLNLVPCVDERLQAQVDNAFSELASPTMPSVILLQEVWTSRAYAKYAKEARVRGFNVFPAQYEDVKDSGLVILTNLEVTSYSFVPFTQDQHAKRGMQIARVETASGPVVVVNTHTAYSDSRGLSLRQVGHLRELQSFLSRLRFTYGGKIIVGGDLNAGPNLTFIGQVYDPRVELWQKTVLKAFEQQGLRPAVVGENTWDRSGNKMVSKPALLIRLFNGFSYGTWGWEENDSILDHLFLSDGIVVQAARVAMKQTIRPSPTCLGRREADNRIHLSDHFAVSSTLSF